MKDMEGRLRDVFSEYRTQVHADEDVRGVPASDLAGSARSSARVLAAVAVAVVLVAASAVVLATRPVGEGDVGVAARAEPAPSAAEFDAAAGAICGAIDEGYNGVEPRFATADAYLVVARSRIQVIDRATGSLVSTQPPRDARRRAVYASALAGLRSARATAGLAADRASAMDVDGAAAALRDADSDVRDAAGVLAAIGIRECGTHDAPDEDAP